LTTAKRSSKNTPSTSKPLLSDGLVYLVTGDRNGFDISVIKRELLKRKGSIKLLVQGGARGVDDIAKFLADSYGIPWKTEKADWNKHKLAAGPIRNQKMLDKYDPDVVLAFHKDLASSKGTKDMVDRARKHGCIVKVFTK
jgi:hypothetical protein